MVVAEHPTSEELVKMMQDYLDEYRELKKTDPKRAREIAVQDLKEIGVLDENGKPRETIVTGMFFGWK